MICVENLSLRLNDATLLDGVSMILSPGRVTAIIGANGAGKTSLVRALAGLIKPRSGWITLDDTPLDAISTIERARRIGYLPQDGEPAWNVTVRELVALGRLPHQSHFAATSAADRDAIEGALAATDTITFANRTIDTLSGGERARVKLARVLAGQPQWILADEPLANLDPLYQRDVLSLFRKAAASGTGVVTVLHQIDAAALAADDVVILKAGRVIAAGPARETLTPRHLEAAFGMAFDAIAHGDRIALLPRA